MRTASLARRLPLVVIAAILVSLSACTRPELDQPPVMRSPEAADADAFLVKLFSNRDFVEKMAPIVETRSMLERASMSEKVYRAHLAEMARQWLEQACPIFTAERQKAGLSEAAVLRACAACSGDAQRLDRLHGQMATAAQQAIAPNRLGFDHFVGQALSFICETLRATVREPSGQLEGDPVPEGRIPWKQALKSAREHLSIDPVTAARMDQDRCFISYNAKLVLYVVDFAKKGATEGPRGQWEYGYYVIVDANTGQVREAQGYKK